MPVVGMVHANPLMTFPLLRATELTIIAGLSWGLWQMEVPLPVQGLCNLTLSTQLNHDDLIARIEIIFRTQDGTNKSSGHVARRRGGYKSFPALI